MSEIFSLLLVLHWKPEKSLWMVSHTTVSSKYVCVHAYVCVRVLRVLIHLKVNTPAETRGEELLGFGLGMKVEFFIWDQIRCSFLNREFDYFKAWVPKSVLTVKRGKFLNLGERYSNLLRSRKECIVKARAGGREKAREFPRLQVVV